MIVSGDEAATNPDVRAMIREQGFDWVSSLYPPHATPRPMEEPGAAGTAGGDARAARPEGRDRHRQKPALPTLSPAR